MVHVEVSVAPSVDFIVDFENPSVDVQVVSYEFRERKVEFLFVVNINR